MKEVIKYQSDAGRIFDTPAEARQDDKHHALACFLYDENNGLCWRDISPEEVSSFLLLNASKVKELLS